MGLLATFTACDADAAGGCDEHALRFSSPAYVGSFFQEPELLDFDGDGDLDLVDLGGPRVWFNDGEGNFEPSSIGGDLSDFARMGWIESAQGGFLDLLVVDSLGEVHRARGSANGLSAPWPAYGIFDDHEMMGAMWATLHGPADLDGDAYPDYLLMDGPGSENQYPHYVYGQPDGSFLVGPAINQMVSRSFGVALHFFDLDGDGVVNDVHCHGLEHGYGWGGNGVCTFGPEGLEMPPGNDSPGSTIRFFDAPRGQRPRDLDGDGLPEVLSQQDTRTWRLSKLDPSSGRYESMGFDVLGLDAKRLFVGSFGDACPVGSIRYQGATVAADRLAGFVFDETVSTFATREVVIADYELGADASVLAVADFDGDGHDDLLIADERGSMIELMLARS